MINIQIKFKKMNNNILKFINIYKSIIKNQKKINRKQKNRKIKLPN